MFHLSWNPACKILECDHGILISRMLPRCSVLVMIQVWIKFCYLSLSQVTCITLHYFFFLTIITWLKWKKVYCKLLLMFGNYYLLTYLVVALGHNCWLLENYSQLCTWDSLLGIKLEYIDVRNFLNSYCLSVGYSF